MIEINWPGPESIKIMLAIALVSFIAGALFCRLIMAKNHRMLAFLGWLGIIKDLLSRSNSQSSLKTVEEGEMIMRKREREEKKIYLLTNLQNKTVLFSLPFSTREIVLDMIAVLLEIEELHEKEIPVRYSTYESGEIKVFYRKRTMSAKQIALWREVDKMSEEHWEKSTRRNGEIVFLHRPSKDN